MLSVQRLELKMSGSEGDHQDDRRNDEQRNEPMSLLVRNLNYGTSTDEIKDFFNVKPDLVKDVYMPKDYQTGKPRGFAFVEFHDKNDAEEAIREMNGKEFNGRELGIIVAQQRRKTPDQMRDLSRGSGGSSRGRRDYNSRYNDRRGGRSRSRSRSPPRRERRRSRSRSRTPPRRERRRSNSRSHDRRRRNSPSRSPRRSSRRSSSGSPRKAGGGW